MSEPRTSERLALRLLTRLDTACTRLYGSRYNPLYQSGTIVVALYLVLLVTGLWLILFYRVGAPYESVARLTANGWTGNWVRGLHRYASDLAVVATVVHAFRMFAQARSWGARALAWVSGAALLGLLFVCGWTGYVMVWDTFGQHLARDGARVVDLLPFLSEPTSRAFTGEAPLPSAFFFLVLFLHIGVPLAMGAVFWLHVKRLARPVLLPPRPLLWAVVGGLTMVAVALPLEMAPPADPFALPQRIPADLFFAFWMPLVPALGAGTTLALVALAALAVTGVPALTRRRGTAVPPPSWVDPDICVGCVQCSLDCPYGAITMVPRVDPRSDLVARVDPSLCVSCGICAGSCPPMGVGPPRRTGRDQVAAVRRFFAAPARRPGEIIVVCCTQGAGVHADDIADAGGVAYPVDCAGNLHTSVIELLLRGGVGGVLVLACPARDCWNREGPRWLAARVHEGREAELQPRVDRRRVRLAEANAAARGDVTRVVATFAAEIAALAVPDRESTMEVDTACEPAPLPRRRRW